MVTTTDLLAPKAVITFHIYLLARGSIPVEGSSKNTIGGLPIIATASDNLRLFPPLYLCPIKRNYNNNNNNKILVVIIRNKWISCHITIGIFCEVKHLKESRDSFRNNFFIETLDTCIHGKLFTCCQQYTIVKEVSFMKQ